MKNAFIQLRFFGSVAVKFRSNFSDAQPPVEGNDAPF